MSIYPSNSVSLTVCMALKGVPEILKTSLEALSQQNLRKDQWEIVLLVTEAHQLPLVEELVRGYDLKVRLFSCFQENSLEQLRNKALKEIPSDLLLFIDEDVILKNPEHLKTLLQLHEQYPETAVLIGGYVSPKGCSFFGRTYNWISRLWMMENPGLGPAGNLSVKTSHLNSHCRFKSPLPRGFGGEEIYFFKKIKATGGFALWKKELDAPHLACHTWWDFFNRAIWHGQSLGLEKENFSQSHIFQSAKLFIKQPGEIGIKVTAFVYLLLVRLVAVLYGFFHVLIKQLLI